MKTNKISFIASGFIAGIIVGISMVGMFAFTNGPGAAAPATGVTPVSAAVANTFFKNYMTGATPLNQVVKGFTLDKSQLDAMNLIIQENSALAGFRVYLGVDNNARKIAIVVGVDGSGKDAVANTIYSTVSMATNPCPPVCDGASAITKN